MIDAVSRSEVTELTRAMVRIDSTNPAGKEHAMAEYLAETAVKAGLEATLTLVDTGRSNVTIRLAGAGEDRDLLYCGHLDTVTTGDEESWEHSPFGAEIIDGRLHGRGSVDMKGGLAAMLAAMLAIKRCGIRPPGDLLLAGVVGEEVDCIGSRRFLDDGGMTDVAWMVIGEPTDLQIVIAHKGCARIRVTTHGVAAHASTPHLGDNAVLRMTQLLPELVAIDVSGRHHELLSASTSTPTTIRGGHAINVVPETCAVEFDIRTTPKQHHGEVLDQFRSVVERFAERSRAKVPDVELFYDRAPMETPVDHQFVQNFCLNATTVLGHAPEISGVNFFTDASVLHPPMNTPTVVFGPGKTELMHQTNEYVEIDDLVRATRVYAALPTVAWG